MVAAEAQDHFMGMAETAALVIALAAAAAVVSVDTVEPLTHLPEVAAAGFIRAEWVPDILAALPDGLEVEVEGLIQKG